jgi:hypothetical protein
VLWRNANIEYSERLFRGQRLTHKKYAGIAHAQLQMGMPEL